MRIKAAINKIATKELLEANRDLRALYASYPAGNCIDGTRAPLMIHMEIRGDMSRWCRIKSRIYRYTRLRDATSEKGKERK